MTDYTELVKALRCCGNEGCHKCPYKKHIHEKFCWVIAMKDAAAAIEALIGTVGDLQAIRERLEEENDALRLEPKRGEIVRCKECIHFTQGGWCDREFDWFPVDENDFCSMAEKMEVQE